MEETSDTLTLAAEERAKQGIHELEISFGGELDLHKHFHKCEKNPRHLKFIPVNIFKEHHLPKHRHFRKIAAWVRQISDLTVKLSVNYVSPNRPSEYPLSDRAGQSVLSVGSGCVTDISLTENNNKMPCPLKKCRVLPGYHVVCGYITIATAAHVVFDDEEAENTTVEFFYDDSSDRSGVMIASGVRVATSSVEGDYCELLCVTHETKLFERLKRKLMCAKKETSDALTLAEERAKQLMQELEISFGRELDFLKNFEKNSKNPGHPDFIPVNKLEEMLLHKHRYPHKITEYEKIPDFTVTLHVNYDSPNRPSGYPLSDRAGQSFLSVGSGFVTDISFKEINDKLPCPLKNCGHLPGYNVACVYITIVTASHVVFDDKEAKNTTVEIVFYSLFGRRLVVKASGVRVAASGVEGDYCELLCATHKTDLFDIFKYKLMCMEETSDSLTLAAEERAKQGMRELRVSFGIEFDLHKHIDNYSNNPGHPNLIPVNKLEELPKYRPSHKTTEYEKISDFTVILYVNYVSHNRPSGYPLSDRAGQRVPSVGSGFVADFSLTENNNKLPCPLKNCGHVTGYHVVCGYITIVTAAHVVFDDEEAKNTTVEIVYDESSDRRAVMIASGVRVAASSVEGDFRALLCVTHETELFERLKCEFILSAKKKTICQLFRTLLPGLESIQYAPGLESIQYAHMLESIQCEPGLESIQYELGVGLRFLAEIRLSNPAEAAEALVVLKAFTEDVIDRVLKYWNPSNNSLSDVLENTSFSKEDMVALIRFKECLTKGTHRNKPALYYISGLADLYSCSCGNNNIKTPLNCQEAILSLISELGEHCSAVHRLQRALSEWDSSRRRDFGNIHKVMKISNDIVTIELTLVAKYAYHDNKHRFDDIENLFDHIKYRLEGIKYVHNIYRKSESNPDHMFLVHIAHPHGQSKHVTIGRQTDCFTGDGFNHQLYTAPTCPGCSGGPVWMIPASGDLSEIYGVPHSGCQGNQLNKGCSWTIYPF